MKLRDFCELLELDLVVDATWNWDDGEIWTAKIRHSDTKKGASDPCITGSFGRGNSAAAAIANYVNEIQGKILVTNALTEARREYKVPLSLEP